MTQSKLNIVLPDVKNVTFGDLDLSVFEKYGNVITYPLSTNEELPERLRDADVILCNKTLLTPETLKETTHLKYIGLFATGYNNVDLNYTNQHEITVCNAGCYSTESVAQHTFALILNHYSKIREYAQYVSNDGWKNSETFSPFIFNTAELYHKTIGIIGFGSIGERVAEIARAFRMKIVLYSRNMNKVEEKAVKIFGKEALKNKEIQVVTLDGLVQNADIITVHCPLNAESEKMINAEFLSKCKKNAFLVNTSRGGVINEEDLYHALQEGVIEGAAIDVLNTEPMSKDSLLANAKNLTITPHIAWAPIETRERLLKIVEDNLKSYLAGTPKNVVSR